MDPPPRASEPPPAPPIPPAQEPREEPEGSCAKRIKVDPDREPEKPPGIDPAVEWNTRGSIENAVQRVYKNLGVVHLESAYRTALAAELHSVGWTVTEEYPAILRYPPLGITVARLKFDIFASLNGMQFVIEIKNKNPTPSVQADALIQGRTYLRTTEVSEARMRGVPIRLAVVFFPREPHRDAEVHFEQ